MPTTAAEHADSALVRHGGGKPGKGNPDAHSSLHNGGLSHKVADDEWFLIKISHCILDSPHTARLTLSHAEAAVHFNDLAGKISRLVPRQKRRQRGNVAGGAHAL